MQAIQFLTGLSLRPFRSGDETALVKHADNRQVARNLRNSFPNPYTLRDALHWIALHQGTFPALSLAICLHDEVIGGIGIIPQKDNPQRAELGYWLGQAHWGKGIMTGAVRAMCAYVFSAGLAGELFAGVYHFNPASMHVLLKAGFQPAGILSNGTDRNGMPVNQHLFILRKTDFDLSGSS